MKKIILILVIILVIGFVVPRFSESGKVKCTKIGFLPGTINPNSCSKAVFYTGILNVIKVCKEVEVNKTSCKYKLSTRSFESYN